MKKEFLLFIIGIVAYSIVAFAYVHNNFPTKDVFNMIVNRLECIDAKLDRLIER